MSIFNREHICSIRKLKFIRCGFKHNLLSDKPNMCFQSVKCHNVGKSCVMKHGWMECFQKLQTYRNMILYVVWSSIHYNGNPYKWYMNPCQWIDDLGMGTLWRSWREYDKAMRYTTNKLKASLARNDIWNLWFLWYSVVI